MFSFQEYKFTTTQTELHNETCTFLKFSQKTNLSGIFFYILFSKKTCLLQQKICFWKRILVSRKMRPLEAFEGCSMRSWGRRNKESFNGLLLNAFSSKDTRCVSLQGGAILLSPSLLHYSVRKINLHPPKMTNIVVNSNL